MVEVQANRQRDHPIDATNYSQENRDEA